MGNEKQDAWIEGMVKVMVDEIKKNPKDNWFNKNYQWKTSPNEVQTIKDFADYSTNLRNAIQNDDEIRSSIIQILVVWGGTINLSHNQGKNKHLHGKEQLNLNNYDFKTQIGPKIDPWMCYIRAYENFRNAEITQGNIHSILNIAREFRDNKPTKTWRIASWSKVLAALEPGKFFIYDSRVAIALAYFCLKTDQRCFWIIPPARDNGNKNDEFEENEQNQTPLRNFKAKLPKAKSTYTCYFRYHQLLRALAENEEIKKAYKSLPEGITEAYEGRDKKKHQAGFTKEQAIMAHIEKMLFMMKEEILGQYAGQPAPSKKTARKAR